MGVSMKNTENRIDAQKVWNAFKQMKTYLEKSAQILTGADKDNYYTNDKGKRMYDGVSTLLNCNIGHCNEDVISAIHDQLTRLDNTTMFTSTNDISIQCSKTLCEMSSGHYYSTFFTNSGSEACDSAIKIVRKYWHNKGQVRRGIVALKGAYHGSSIGAMLLAHDGYEMEEYGLTYDDFYQISCPDDLILEGLTAEEGINRCVEEFEELLLQTKTGIGAFFLELVQLSNAVNALPVEYVLKMYEICKREGILFVIDEVATGFGRTGSMFAYEQYGVRSDLLMFAKGVTSGYIPMGGVLVTEEVFKTFWGETEEGLELCHGYTTGGHPAACAAALENIRILKEKDLVQNAKIKGLYLMEELQKQCGAGKLVKAIRGKGLMIAVIFEDIKIPGMKQWGIADIMSKFTANKGLLLYPDDPEVLIVAPPLTVSEEECDRIVSILADCLRKIEMAL